MPSGGQADGVNRSSRSATDAALRGASLAFSKKPPPKPAKPDTYSGHDGALAAAIIASPSNNHLRLPKDQEQSQVRPRSQSLLAANIAASRSPSVSPRYIGLQDPPPQALPKTVSKRLSTSVLSPGSSASTTASLARVPLEEKSRSYARERDDSKSIVRINGQDEPSINQPAPPKNPRIEMLEKETPERTKSQRLQVNASNSSAAKQKSPEIKLPKPIRLSGPFRSGDQKLISTISNPSDNVQRSNILDSETVDYEADLGKTRDREESYSSDDSFVSASDHQETVQLRHSIDATTFRQPSQDAESLMSSALQRLPVRPPTKRAITPHMTGDSLADAIVASSLASSRAASPTKIVPPVPAPRRHRHTFFSHHHESQQNKPAPPPVRGLKRHTMRKTSQSDEEDGSSNRRGHRHLVKKHPHKHHEGDRKRWRDEITERERKRYLAVWASNKGIHTSNAKVDHNVPLDSPGDDLEAQVVCNLVVRDVFSRSRLGDDVLGEVYDLVNRDETGGLSREEFVVGLWLIDQRLKGRKLPIKVSPSVWESVVGRAIWKVPRP